MRALPALVAGLLAGCGRVPAAPPGPAEPLVRVTDLTIEVDRPAGDRLVVHAEGATFEGLPGQGRGLLEGVEVSAGSGTPEVSETRARAARAEIGGDGALLLEDATVTAHLGASPLAFHASRARLEAGGGLEAEGVRARLEAAP